MCGEALHSDVPLRIGQPGMRQAMSSSSGGSWAQAVHQSWWEDWRRRVQKGAQGEGGGQAEDRERGMLLGDEVKSFGSWHPD